MAELLDHDHRTYACPVNVKTRSADSDEVGHAFQLEAGHCFRTEAGRGSDLKPAT